MDTVFNMQFERTEFSDDSYAIVGRALAYAQWFEGDGKALALLVDMWSREIPERSPLDSEEDFERLVMRLYEAPLGSQIARILRRLDLPQDVREILQSARLSRNVIAHEICLGIQPEIETDVGRQRLIAEISAAVRRIAEGHLVILAGITVLTNEQSPTKHYWDSYCDRVVAWVCSIEE